MGKIRFPHLGFDVSMGNSFSIFGFEIAFYGIIIALGMIAGAFVAYRDAKRTGQRVDDYVDYTLFGIIGAIVGARLYYVAFEWDYYKENLSEIVNLRAGGLAIYGGIIGGLVAILLFARKRRINPFILTDMVVPPVALAQAIGRWGNYFNMEAFGREIIDPAWQFFPIAVQIPTASGYVWHMATFFYESMWDLATFCILWWFRKRARYSGHVTLCYLFLYGLGRAFIEGLRTDSLMLGSFRVSQLLSISLTFLAAVLLFLNQLKHRNTKEL